MMPHFRRRDFPVSAIVFIVLALLPAMIRAQQPPEQPGFQFGVDEGNNRSDFTDPATGDTSRVLRPLQDSNSAFASFQARASDNFELTPQASGSIETRFSLRPLFGFTDQALQRLREPTQITSGI